MFDVHKASEDIFDQLRTWREDFHEYPELDLDLERTSAIVADHLKKLGLEVHEHIGKTGIVGVLRGSKPGKTIALRADMDALPITEATGLPYSSRIPGRMHACGHDGHTAMLMGTAQILAAHRDQLNGNVVFFFQPGEEGAGGAKAMVADGALDICRPDAIFGAHMQFRECGMISLRKGYSHLAADSIFITLHGHGGHGAKPHENNDTLLAACKLVCDLQYVVSRGLGPLEPAVLTVGAINSGTKENIMPDTAELKITLRTMGEDIRKRCLDGIDRVTKGVAAEFGCTFEIRDESTCDALYNTPELCDIALRATTKVLGQDKVIEEPIGRPGSEDFGAFLSTGIPGAYIFVHGAYPGEAKPSQNHQPTYNWDENAMKAGVCAEVATVLEFLDSWD